jgi:hypothetical protein
MSISVDPREGCACCYPTYSISRKSQRQPRHALIEIGA